MIHRHAWNGPFITVSGAYEGRMASLCACGATLYTPQFHGKKKTSKRNKTTSKERKAKR